MAPNTNKTSNKSSSNNSQKKPDVVTQQLPTPVSALSPASEHVLDQVKVYKAAVSPLRTSLDMLGDELQKLQIKGPSKLLQDEIASIHDEMGKFNATQKKERALIEEGLNDLLKEAVDQMVKRLVADGIEKYLDECIKTNVTRMMKQLPTKRSAVDKLKESEENLKKLQIELHNAESYRLNGLLVKGDDDQEPLNTIIKPDGQVSELFPKTFGELCNLTPLQAKKLLKEYNVTNSVFSGNEEWKSINRFMYFVGASYQLP